MTYENNRWYKTINKYDNELFYIYIFGRDKRTIYYKILIIKSYNNDDSNYTLTDNTSTNKEFREWFENDDYINTIVIDEYGLVNEVFLGEE